MGLYEFNSDDLRRFVQFQGAKIKPRGDELVFTYCPICHGGKSRDTNTFAVNIHSGLCHCMRAGCGYKGNMVTLARDTGFELSDDVSRYYDGDRRFKKWRPVEGTTDPAIAYMLSRGISREVTERYRIRTRKDNDSILVFPFFDEKKDVIRFIKYRNTQYIKGESIGNKEWSEAGGMPYLFGADQCDPERSKTLVMTEGQIDSLSLTEAGIPNAVSVPIGKNGFTWVPHCWDFLMQYDELVIFGDKETDGTITLLDEMKRRYSKRIRCVDPDDYGEGCKDANDILLKYGREQLKRCVEKARPLPVGGLVDLAKVKRINPYELEKLPTGIQNIDKLFYGGLPFGGLVVITGKTGDGKSTLASQILANAIVTGYKCFIYSGELSAPIVKETVYRQLAGSRCEAFTINGWGDKGYKVSEADWTELDRFIEGKCSFFDIYDLDSMDEELSLMGKMKEAIQRNGAKVLLVDNLMSAQEFEELGSQDKYEKQSVFMRNLARLAITYDVLVLLVAHGNKGEKGEDIDRVSGSADIVNVAEAVIHYGKRKTINRGTEAKPAEVKDPEAEDRKREIKVLKNRHFGRLNLNGFDVDYDEASKQIIPVMGKVRDIYGWNKDRQMRFEPVDSSNIDEIPF